MSPTKKEEIERKAKKIAAKTRQAVMHPRVGLRTKFPFLLFRSMQKGDTSSWNPTDHDWWKQQGWLDKVRPWKK